MTDLEFAAGLAIGQLWLWHSIGDGLYQLEPKLAKHLSNATLFIGPVGKDANKDAEWVCFIGEVCNSESSSTLVAALRGG